MLNLNDLHYLPIYGTKIIPAPSSHPGPAEEPSIQKATDRFTTVDIHIFGATGSQLFENLLQRCQGCPPAAIERCDSIIYPIQSGWLCSPTPKYRLYVIFFHLDVYFAIISATCRLINHWTISPPKVTLTRTKSLIKGD